MKKFLTTLARTIGAAFGIMIAVIGLMGVLAYYQELMALPFAALACAGFIGAVMCITTDEPDEAPTAKRHKSAAASSEVAA